MILTRYIATTYNNPIAGSLTRSTRSTIATAIAIWVLAIVCGMPAVLGSNLKVDRFMHFLIVLNVRPITNCWHRPQQFHVNENKSFLACYPFPDEWGPEYAKSIVLIRFLIYYAIPLIVIAIFYMMIARHLVYAANFPGEMHGAARQVKALALPLHSFLYANNSTYRWRLDAKLLWLF